MTVMITGADGQDGYFLAKYFNRAGCRVVGTTKMLRQPCGEARYRYFDDLVTLDLEDPNQIADVITRVQPKYLVNMAAIADSWSQFIEPNAIFKVNLGAVVAMLETIRALNLNTVLVQASSSEIFAGGLESPQSIQSCRIPRTIYGASKIAADNTIAVYRNQFGLECFSVILFSHESPLRKDRFFTKRVVSQALDVYEGKSKKIEIYTPDSMRDWGYAGDYCRLLVDYILSGRRSDSILGTGVPTSVRAFTRYVCDEVGLKYEKVVVELAEIKGRAVEGRPMVADKECNSFIGGENVMDVRNLVKLLVRYARYERRAIRQD